MSRVTDFLKVLKPSATLVAILTFVFGTLFGTGVLFNYTEDRRAKTKLIVDFEAKLLEYESAIQQMVPRYVKLRDGLPQDENEGFEARVEYSAVRNQLISQFITYNRIEARLSELESRGARFLLPVFIPPRPPLISEVRGRWEENGESGSSMSISITIQEDDVSKEVFRQLEILLDGYGESFRHEYYRQACQAELAHFCTRLATALSSSSETGRLSSESRALHERGCRFGDPVSCDVLAYARYVEQDFVAAEYWLTLACKFNRADSCMHLGALQTSKVLGKRRDLKTGRLYLQKACEIGSPKGCYALAVLLVSGEIERDPETAKIRLDDACAGGYRQGCDAALDFDSFQQCKLPAAEPASGISVSIPIVCEQSNRPMN